MKLVLLCVALVACGGKIDTGDAGSPGGVDSGTTAKDSQPAIDVISPPPNPNCTPQAGSISVGADGSCAGTAEWSCGSTKYSVKCSCPSDQCACTQQDPNNGMGTMISNVPNLCPSCSANFAAICGFPSN